MGYAVGDLRCGDLLLMQRHTPILSANGLLDVGITVSTVNPFDHAAVVVRQNGRLVVVEALWHVAVSPLDKYTADGTIFRPHLTPPQQRTLSAALLSKVGQRYGLSMVWDDLLRDDLHIDVHPRLDPRHLDCSGLAVWGYSQADYPTTYAPVPSPADLSYSAAFTAQRPWTTP